jgi:hypothetical protein
MYGSGQHRSGWWKRHHLAPPLSIW